MIRGSDMSREAGYCKIVTDTDGSIARWVCNGLGLGSDWVGPNYTCGFVLGGKLIGGLIFNDIEADRNLWWTIYSTDKRWTNRRTLSFVFEAAFCGFNVRRISLLVDCDNTDCLNFVEKLGFKREGLLREFGDDGQNRYVLGMLKNECKFLRRKCDE